MATPDPDPNRSKGLRSKLTDDNRKATEELGAILLQLRAHLTQGEIDKLLLDDDADVRFAAATTLGSKSDELRLSAIKSAMRGSSMAEVLANRRRARGKPPISPRLEDMSADELVSRFIDAGERKGLADRFLDWGTVKADAKICDKLIDEINDVHDFLKARGLLARFQSLMDHENPRVRLGAALTCLGLDEPKALATLEELEKTGWFREKDEARLNPWRLRLQRSR